MFSECFYWTVKTLWQDTCDPLATNFPTLAYIIFITKILKCCWKKLNSTIVGKLRLA